MKILSFKKFEMILLFFCILTFSAKAQQSLPLLYNKNHHTIVIAHRGDHVHVPENTLAAYRQAITCGADYVEVDLRTTKDGHLVVMHNTMVNEMTNGKGAVKELTYKQIRNLEIHNKRKGDNHIYHVPDFKSVLNTCKGHINIYLDFKDANVAQTYKFIKEAGMQNHIAVYLNKKEQYAEWKKVAPKMPLIASIPEKMDIPQLDSLLNTYKINVVDNIYNAEKIKLLSQKGIVAWLDVEGKREDTARWAKVSKMGAEGLQTDHPEELIRFLQKMKMR